MFKQFSFPGGISSHVAPETPGSINEGGELGYSIAHAFGAAFDNPDLIVACTVGDGEAETGPLATSWQSNKFLNPVGDGAVLPILHLNGYKISNPTVFGRMTHEEIESFFKGCSWKPYFVEGDDPMTMHEKMADTLDPVINEIHDIQNLSVHGYQEEGTITTPFDMRVQNEIDRFHLVKDAVLHLPQLGNRGAYLVQQMNDKLVEHKNYIHEVGQDMPEILDWKWHI